MSAANNRRRRGVPAGGHEGGDERWLLTYADMITLLMALFIVMWAISSTNITKFKELKQSLNQAFSGKIIAGNQHVLSGGSQIMEQGSEGREGSGQAFFDPRTAISAKVESARIKIAASFQKQAAAARQQEALAESKQLAAANEETESLRKLQSTIHRYARSHGFASLISTKIDERGLVVRLLTDEVLFTVGSADLQTPALPLLAEISKLLAGGRIRNQIRVEGNTDSQPIHSARFPSNWELSTARASAVLEVLLHQGVPAGRLSVAGYADQRPVSTNATREGRARNRHVDLVVLRRTPVQGG